MQMKTTKLEVKLKNKKLDGFLNISVKNETKKLSSENNSLFFEVPQGTEITFTAEYEKYDFKQIKSPVGRFFAYLFFFLLSPILFFADTDENGKGIGVHKFFQNADPFKLKKTFALSPKESICLEYIPPKYNKSQKSYSFPDVRLLDVTSSLEELSCSYDRAAFKKAFRLYHYPAYVLLFAVLIALNALMISCLAAQISGGDAFGVAGLSFCTVVTLALLITVACIFISTLKLYKAVDEKLI